MEGAPLPADWRISHYRVVASLGKGGMGEVYAAVDETLKRRVALKSVRADHRLSAEAKARFLREARLLSQLDHPHVCRVYDYVEDRSADWLVLELIDGRSLRDHIAQGLDTRRRMTIAEQIAAVLVATHAAGVVHRDLKPANVMITTGGDVKVLDFGLAQPVRAVAEFSGRDQSRLPVAHLPDAALETTQIVARTAGPSVGLGDEQESLFRTVAGSVSGTVAYMSPEQASGNPATAASDMYSFGLLLQELFTGKPPYYADLGAAELLERARRADTPAVEGLRADLAVLINRLKAHTPSQRPTAIDAAERLRWIREKPKRRVRQLVVAGLIASAFLGIAKYTLDLERERTAAVAARTEADQRRTQAESLIGFMLGNLRPKLQQVGRLDLLEDVGREATSYFKTVPIGSLTNEELYRQSQSIYQLGLVHQQRGNLALAVESFRDSLALMTEVAARAPEHNEWQLGLGTAHFYLGDALRRQGDLDGALGNFRSYWQIAERVLARASGNPAYRLEVSFGHSNVAAILEVRGDLRGARSELETTLALKEEVVKADPANADWQRTLASSHNRLGVVLHKLGDLAGAKQHYQRDVAILSGLLAKSPGNATLQSGLVVSQSWLATVLEDLGETGEALALRQRVFEMTQTLVVRDAGNADWQREQALARMRLTELTRPQAGSARAEADHRESVAALAALLAKSPKDVRRRRDVAEARRQLARLLLDSGKPEAAWRETEQCLSVLAPLLSGSDADALRVAVGCRLAYGDALVARGRSVDAAAHRAAAVAAIEPLARSSEDPAILQLWARALRAVGRLDESKEVAAKLMSRGYRHPSFLQVFKYGARPT